MKITPRFVKRSPIRGYHNFPDAVPVLGGLRNVPDEMPILSSGIDGRISIRAQIDAEGEPAVYVEFSREEVARMAQFSADCVNRKPIPSGIYRRAYLIGGEHRATVRGW